MKPLVPQGTHSLVGTLFSKLSVSLVPIMMFEGHDLALKTRCDLSDSQY